MAGPHGLIISHGPLYSTCKTYGLSVLNGFIHVGLGEEKDFYIDVATDYYELHSYGFLLLFACSAQNEKYSVLPMPTPMLGPAAQAQGY